MLLVGVLAVVGFAQETTSSEPSSRPASLSGAGPAKDIGQVLQSLSATSPATGPDLPEHRFSDRDNAWLFSAVAASRTLDYFSTLNMRRRGRQEVFLTNDIVDNHAAFAAIEAGGTAVSIGASYLFHRYHHHRLEHWTSIVHASLATGGAVRNYCLKTVHPSSGP
jgi:hypothetical protein